jgi:plastocyanin
MQTIAMRMAGVLVTAATVAHAPVQAAPPCPGCAERVSYAPIDIGDLFAMTAFDQRSAGATLGTPDETIIVQNFAYSPAEITIPVGGVVRWTNKDFFFHTATSQSGPDIGEPSGLFDLPLDGATSADFQFDAPGDYWYYCIPHGVFMQGVIHVKAASVPGDLNCDGVASVSDISPFVLALTDPPAYEKQFPECDIQRADMNNDGAISVSDIAPFVAVLTGG